MKRHSKQAKHNGKPNPVMIRIRKTRGTASKIAAAFDISREAVWNWHQVPANRVLGVELLLGIPRHLIRPDLYPPPYHPRTRRWIERTKRSQGSPSDGESSGHHQQV